MSCEPVLVIYVTAKPDRAVSSSILPPSLLNSSQGEGLTSKSIMFPFPSLGGGAGERVQWACQSVPAMLCVPLTSDEGHVSPCRYLLCLGLSGQEELRLAEPWDCRIITKSVLFATATEIPGFHEFSANQEPSIILPHRQKWRWHELVLVGLTSS